MISLIIVNWIQILTKNTKIKQRNVVKNLKIYLKKIINKKKVVKKFIYLLIVEVKESTKNSLKNS